VAYIPDLGEDVIKQFVYDPMNGTLSPAGKIPADVLGKGPFGPRCMEFHPTLPVAYLVNEISCSVSVFEFVQSNANLLINKSKSSENFCETLIQIQSISTIPFAFPKNLNTCSSLKVDPTGNFVLVSNRGHNSIAIFSISPESGKLTEVGICHTLGKTPRHFQFDKTGKYLIVGNQDTNSIAVFLFNQKTGALMYTGYAYEVPSPNFVCVCAPHMNNTSRL